jgi:PST family polysaccharide transporter
VLTVDAYGMVSYVRATIIYMQIFVDFGFSLSAVKDIARIKNDKTRVGEITGDVIIAKLLLCAIGMLILLVLCVSISILQNNLLYTLIIYYIRFYLMW